MTLLSFSLSLDHALPSRYGAMATTLSSSIPRPTSVTDYSSSTRGRTCSAHSSSATIFNVNVALPPPSLPCITANTPISLHTCDSINRPHCSTATSSCSCCASSGGPPSRCGVLRQCPPRISRSAARSLSAPSPSPHHHLQHRWAQSEACCWIPTSSPTHCYWS